MNRHIVAAALLGLAGPALAQTPPPAPADGVSFSRFKDTGRDNEVHGPG